MKSILRYNELWGYVNGTITKTEGNVAQWTLKDEKALDLIILNLHKTQYNHIKRAETSLEAWEALRNVYESKGPMRQCILFKQLYKMKKERNQSMAYKYVDKFVHKVEQLTEAGIKLSDTVIPIMLLTSLPIQYETFCIAIESRERMPTLDELKVKLLEEEIRKTDNDLSKDTDKEMALLSNKKTFQEKKQQKESLQKQKPEKAYNRKYNDKCYICGKAGHIARFCKNKQRIVTSRNHTEEAMLASALNTSLDTSYGWYLDSGATAHMCKDRRMFETLNEEHKEKVCTATESSTLSQGKGEIKMSLSSRNKQVSNIKLQDVMWVPEFRTNLMSVPSITKNGYSVTFNGDSAVIKRRDGTVVLTVPKKNDLYIVKPPGKQQSMFAGRQTDEMASETRPSKLQRCKENV